MRLLYKLTPKCLSGCSFIPGTNSFRTAWAIQFIPCVFLLAGLPFLPRSPRWLAKVGRVDEAIEILARIQAGGDMNDPLVVAEWEEITTILAAERGKNPSDPLSKTSLCRSTLLLEVEPFPLYERSTNSSFSTAGQQGWRRFILNGMWKRTFAGMSVQAWQQLSGANVMTYYVVYIFEMAGLTGNINLISSGIQYAIFIIGTAATFFFIDVTGRRPLLIYGAVGMGICMFVVGGVLGSYGTPLPNGLNGNLSVKIQATGAPANTVIAFCYLLVLTYAITLAPMAWVYAAEVWSLETRATGMALASIANWLFNFAIGFFIPPAFENISWKLFIIFGVLCFGAAVQAYFTYPETAGKTIEEIEMLFSTGAIKPWKTKPGNSLLDAKIEEVKAQHKGIGDVAGEKTAVAQQEYT